MPENPPSRSHPDPKVQAMQAMARVGNFAGRALYYASHSDFTVPGLYYWNAYKNVWLCDSPDELSAAAARLNADFELWPSPDSNGTLVGDLYAKALLRRPALHPVPPTPPGTGEQPSLPGADQWVQGGADSRLAAESNVPGTPDTPTRFRPRYRSLSPLELGLHDAIKTKAEELLRLYGMILSTRARVSGVDERQTRHNAVDGIPPSVPQRDLALATTHLEDSVMRAIRALTAPIEP